MPIYEYQCPECPKVFEAFVRSFALRHVKQHCPDCRSESTYGGISQVQVGREGYFGLIMKDGSRVRGSLPR